MTFDYYSTHHAERRTPSSHTYIELVTLFSGSIVQLLTGAPLPMKKKKATAVMVVIAQRTSGHRILVQM